ncbi:polyphosphate kinase [Fodinibius roseus]|uniref:Polyphosphate kinase n=1 Tax=Fodinibius roseus TaxID=1194090 RepID=A0A1M4ZFJ1_9BACT|nr:polyphosphate kinase 1 [Fodinibius roseus]SHF16366.1 polyphosphate kinase [Fodinibius roseus]
MSEFTAKEVAVYLYNEIKRLHTLTHSAAAKKIEETFNGSFLVQSENGNKALPEEVLSHLKGLSSQDITWNPGRQAWIFKGSAPDTKEIERPPQNFEIPTSVKAQEVPENASVDDSSLYLNRELGWLDFNWRVLAQAMDDRHPLLERVRFLAITASNLDEFIQKRAGGLKRQKAAGIFDLSPDGRTAESQLGLVQREAGKMQQSMLRVWNNELRPLLEENAGVRISFYKDLTKKQRETLDHYFIEHIYPTLTPLAVDPGHPFPFISNLSLSLAVKLKHPNREAFNFARVKVPSNQPRWIELESDSYAYLFVPVEEIIRQNIERLFRGMKVDSTCAFRITRNADLRRNEEEAEDLLSMMSDELRERRFAEVVRLEVEDDVDPNVLELLKNELQLSDNTNDIIYQEGMLDLSACFTLAELKIPYLKYKPWKPVIPRPLYHEEETGEEQTVFDVISKGDLLVHHPYESFSGSVRRLIEEAADDPKVIAIKQTLYRTSDDSPIVKALIRAAEKEKQVAVLVEVKARFDEASNIEWGKKLENAGVHVAYGLVGLKTHAKVALIVREEGDKHVTYCHIGTGNYHIHTAEIYTDLGLLTKDPVLGHDISNLFHYLTGYAPDQHYEKLLVAPMYLRESFYELIDREIEHAKAGKEARIIAKMNALDDISIIQRLYKASQAGVRIDLIVRGHCRLRPQLEGYSENIHVLSIIGRFLEHDRIYYFENEGSPQVFIGSGDWRYRNMDERVEAIVPITLPKLKSRIVDILSNALQDNRLAWDMHADGSYRQRQPGNEEVHNFHNVMMDDTQK